MTNVFRKAAVPASFTSSNYGRALCTLTVNRNIKKSKDINQKIFNPEFLKNIVMQNQFGLFCTYNLPSEVKKQKTTTINGSENHPILKNVKRFFISSGVQPKIWLINQEQPEDSQRNEIKKFKSSLSNTIQKKSYPTSPSRKTSYKIMKPQINMQSLFSKVKAATSTKRSDLPTILMKKPKKTWVLVVKKEKNKYKEDDPHVQSTRKKYLVPPSLPLNSTVEPNLSSELVLPTKPLLLSNKKSQTKLFSSKRFKTDFTADEQRATFSKYRKEYSQSNISSDSQIIPNLTSDLVLLSDKKSVKSEFTAEKQRIKVPDKYSQSNNFSHKQLVSLQNIPAKTFVKIPNQIPLEKISTIAEYVKRKREIENAKQQKLQCNKVPITGN